MNYALIFYCVVIVLYLIYRIGLYISKKQYNKIKQVEIDFINNLPSFEDEYKKNPIELLNIINNSRLISVGKIISILSFSSENNISYKHNFPDIISDDKIRRDAKTICLDYIKELNIQNRSEKILKIKQKIKKYEN